MSTSIYKPLDPSPSPRIRRHSLPLADVRRLTLLPEPLNNYCPIRLFSSPPNPKTTRPTMKSIFSLSIAVAAMLAGTCAATDSMLDSVPNAQLVGRQDTTYQWEGCFSDPGTMKFNSIGQWQSKQNCHDACVPAGFSVEATTNKSACWCGNQLPPKANLVDNSKCNLNCTGYPQELCRFTPTLGVGAPF